MGLSKSERPVFAFTKGLNTDASEVVFPPDFSTDEQNYELLLDGTRRRRRGLEGEHALEVIEEVENPDPFFDDCVALVQAHTGTLTEATGNPTMQVVGAGAISSGQVKFGSASFRNPGTTVGDLDYVKLEDRTDSEGLFVFPGEFTLEGWYYFVSVTSVLKPFTGLLTSGPSGILSMALRPQPFTFDLVLGSPTTGLVEAALPVPIGQWVFLAITRGSDDKIRIFVDGLLGLTSVAISGTVGALSPTKSNLGICFAGDAGLGGGADADCYFDQIRITKRCRYLDTFTVPSEPFAISGPVPDPSTGLVTDDQPEDAVVRTFKWRAVGGDPDVNFHCVQIGSTVFFMDDVELPSTSIRNFQLDLSTISVDGFGDVAGENLIDMAFGRGQALIVGKYLEPHFIDYDVDTDSIITTPIDIRERDFQGVEDGFDNQTKPGTLSDAYQYNLVNQGWVYGDILTFHTEQGSYPSKNMIPWFGYRRRTVTNFDPNDGTKEFSSDKLVAELFQDAPSPRGHFVRNPFDTNATLVVETETIKNYVSLIKPSGHGHFDQLAPPGIPSQENGPNYMSVPGTTLLTFKFDSPHFLGVGDVVNFFTETQGKIGSTTGDGNRLWSITGNHTVEAVVDDNSISFYNTIVNDAAGWTTSWPFSYWPIMYAFVGGDTLSIEGTVIDERPTAVAFFAGRAVYAGVPHPSLGSAIFFSPVVEVDAQYGKCYQVADPTSDKISDLVDTDGLVLRIPELGRVYRLTPYGASLIVYASNGIWQVGPGAAGYFTATSYSVRKLSDVQVVNATSVMQAEGVPCFWASSGIFAIVEDSNTGFLVVRSLTQSKIDTLYAELGETARKTATGDFDQVNKRAVWVYIEDDEYFALVYDLRFEAFTKLAFTVPVADIFTVTELNDADSTLRYICFTSNSYYVGSATSRTFQDFGEDTEAFLVTGFDTADSPARRKHAPVVSVFSKRTEIATEGVVTNESSTLMQARWDWADNTVAGKWGSSRQVYRKSRVFTPSTTNTGTLDDGYPIVVTRNKVRGRGRSLHLKFAAEAGKDSHVSGWSINYTVLTDV